MMIRVTKHYRVDQSPQDFFAFISNPESDPKWQSSVRYCEFTGPFQPARGARYNIGFRFMGKKIDFLAEISEFEPGKRFAYRSLEGPFEYRGFYDMYNDAGGTAVAWTFEAEPAGFFGIIPRLLLQKGVEKQVEGDVKRLQRLLLTQAA